MTEAAVKITDINAATMGMNPNDPMAQRRADDYRRELEQRARYVSPPGTLGLPPLLDERRCGYLVPDGAFRGACLFDRCLLWPLPEWDGQDEQAAPGSLILLSSASRSNNGLKSPRSLLIGAGLKALDILRSNGVDLGHVVYLLHLNPWWINVETSSIGTEWAVRAVSVEHILMSEDLETERRAGQVKFTEGDDGLLRVERGGKPLTPMQPNVTNLEY